MRLDDQDVPWIALEHVNGAEDPLASGQNGLVLGRVLVVADVGEHHEDLAIELRRKTDQPARGLRIGAAITPVNALQEIRGYLALGQVLIERPLLLLGERA